MPGQVTHFYLASRLAEKFPQSGIRGYIKRGFKQWIQLNKDFNADTVKLAKEKAHNGEKEMQALLNTYRENIIKSNEIAIFGAFCAGAVGPDIWTVPVSNTVSMLGSGIKGSSFFDMGHYNLSHLFPKYTLEKIKGGSLSGLQKRYVTAYILGFISHISLDIVAHLNVNVFAGAYHNQQSDQWETEQGGGKENIKSPFNNHNKIEHYLDAFIRFFCFEGWYDEKIFAKHKDYGKYKKYINIVRNDFGQKDKWYFPNYSDYYKKIMRFGRIIKTNGIKNYPDECFLDLSTSLPGPFAHRYYIKGQKKVKPFIRDYTWKAYEDKLDGWLKKGPQSISSLKDETIKVGYFSFIDDEKWRDIEDEITTQYYYLHTVIPNLDKVVKNTDKFYSPADFGHFIQGAIKIANKFTDNAVQFLKGGSKSLLDCLDHWNLDTGLALRIKKGKNTPDYTVPVCLDIVSVLDDPALKGWKIPQVKNSNVKNNANLTWNPLVEQKKESEVNLDPKKTLFTSHKKYKLVKTTAIGIELQVKHVCFYKGDNYSEIGAYIFGDSENKEKPWVKGESAAPADKTVSAFKITTCIEDFKSSYSQTNDMQSSGRKSRLYKSIFVGHSGKAQKSNNNDIQPLNSVEERTLERHIKITTCRKGINYVNDPGNFAPEKLSKYSTIFPCEDMLYSIFAFLKKEEEGTTLYEDIYHDVPHFEEKHLAELKKIKVIGLNTILLILKSDKNKKVILEEAWVDGELQKI